MSEQPKLRVPALMDEMWSLMKPAGLLAALAYLTVSAVGMLADINWSRPGLDGLMAILGWSSTALFQYLVTRSAVREAGLVVNGGAGFGRFLVMWVVAAFATGFGFVALIVPGILLAALWSAAGPVMLAEDESVTGALGASWDRTKIHLWPIVLLLGVIWVPALIGGAALYRQIDAQGALADAAVTNLLLSAPLVISWFACVAIYKLTRPGSQLAEVFA